MKAHRKAFIQFYTIYTYKYKSKMNMNKKKLAALGGMSVLTGMLAVGIASADTMNTTNTNTDNTKQGKSRGEMKRGGMKDTGALATALGMSETDVKSALASGKTIDTLISEKGLSQSAVMQALHTAHEKEMDARIASDIASGKLTQTQADEMKAERAQRETQMKAHLATALGMTTAELDQATTSGKTIDQITTERGLTKEAVHTKLDELRTQDMKARLASDVASGKITQTQADEMMTKKNERGTRGGGPGFGPMGEDRPARQ